MLGLPVVFLIGLLLGSFGRAGEVDELVTRIGATTPEPRELTAAVALALGDPEAVVVYARTDVGDGYVDEAGRPVPTPTGTGPAGPPRRYNGRTVGGILHREDLVADPAAMEVLGGIVAMGIDAQRLAAQQLALLADLNAREADLNASRRRLLQAEDTERRRISRDLHDGAQQHIVLLGLNARRLSRSAADPEVAATAAGIADGMTGLLTEFRDLVAGIMPAPLIDRGLVPALELLAERMPLPTTVHGGGAAGTAARRGGVDPLLRRVGGPDQRRQARGGDRRTASGSRGPTTTARRDWSSRSPTTAWAGPTPSPGPGCAGWPTGSPRSAGR